MPNLRASKPFTSGPPHQSPRRAGRGQGSRPYSSLYLDADAGRKAESLQSIDDARVDLEDVDDALVRAHLELLARVRVDERGADDGQLGNLSRKGNGAGRARVGSA